MRNDQIKTAADNFGISLDSAVTMRVRYLMSVIDQCFAYMMAETDAIPEMDVFEALDEIVRLKKFAVLSKVNRVGKNAITDEMIAEARNYPIEQVIEFNRGVALAFCHTDKRPSLSLDSKRNRAHCFPCGKDFSALDVKIERDGMSFVDAVRELSGRL